MTLEIMQYEWVGDYEVTLLYDPEFHDAPYLVKAERGGGVIRKLRCDSRLFARSEFDYYLRRCHEAVTTGEALIE